MGLIKAILKLLLLAFVIYSLYIIYMLIGPGWMAIGIFLIVCLIAIILLIEVAK